MQVVDHTESIIELYGVTFSYSGEEVIKNVTIALHRGDYLGIVGPNGGGKSTLIKLMLGLVSPKRGSVKLFGQDISKFRDWYKIGYVPQKNYFDINFPVTVSEVVLMGTYARRGLFHFTTKEDHKKAQAALEQVEMSDFAKRQISDLSGGQQQRVFIARALVTQPEIIFMDEPTVGVDVKSQKRFYDLLRRLNREMDLTLVLSTHELDVVGHEATELGYINRTLDYWGDPQIFLKGDYFHKLIGRGGLHH